MAKSKCKSESASSKNQKTSPPSTSKLNLVSLLVALLAMFAAISLFGLKQCPYGLQDEKPSSTNKQSSGKTQKIFWYFTNNNQSYYLKEVFTVLKRLGYENGTITSDWDLLWAFNWPFEAFKEELMNLKPYQKVNHFPGTGVINTKVLLATSGLEYIPPAFRLPEDKAKLLEYSKKNPQSSFVLKDNYHRKIKVAKIDEIDFNQSQNFVQEFIDKPLLIDGYKFDIGLYTIITSVDPLRIYVYNGDIMLRFCPEKYLPFDSENLDKYVIGDDYFPVWKVPGLDYYYNTLGFSKKETLNAYLQRHEIDTSSIWRQAEDAIAKYVLAKEADIIQALKRYPSKRNFFEMVRFDFIIDEQIKVHMLESNMSPNLSAEKHAANKLLYHQVLYNLFGLVGVADSLNRASLAPRSNSETEMIVAEKNLVTFPNICNSPKCKSSCAFIDCQLCKNCLTDEIREFLQEAAREHNHRGDCKRIYPPPMVQISSDMIHQTQKEALQETNIGKLSPHNQLQYRWFQGKCNMDKSWC
ncbi:unnamed protein product [Psylliodes chrysocephalus]|uniref:Tubulin polyglutamylase ttll-15 n=1 Tax=Psylliodes chrysocephalus TaxID=3402493 RepID=A0A9P0GJW8_9CUCU|nr:unnamed protein product [Psylliodes chrysocephala]